MAIVVVGGQSKDIGKTSVVAGLIAAMPEMRWMAIKIRQTKEPVCTGQGEGCDCVTTEHSVAVREEREAGSGTDWTDSVRYLAAGAVRAFWMRVLAGRMAEAMPWIGEELAGAENVVIESNSVLEFLQPDVYLSVLDPRVADFKDSAWRYLDRADAVVVPREAGVSPEWKEVSRRLVKGTPVLPIEPPRYCSPAVVEFLRRSLVAG